MDIDWILLGLRLLAILILYSFLGTAIYIIRCNLQAVAYQATGNSHQLQVLESSDTQTLAIGDTIPLDTVTLLGSNPKNRLVLADALDRHARLLCENYQWWLEPLTDNGTLLNNTPILTPTQLANGDVIQIGDTCFRFEGTET
jgi:hypothetical protein